MTFNRIIIAIIVFSFVYMPFAQPMRVAASAQEIHWKADSIIVKYRDSDAIAELAISASEGIEAALKRVSADPRVEYAEPNYIYETALLSNDPEISSQWYLRRVRAPEAWAIRSGSPQIVIAVIDSGVQISHPDLKPNLWVNAAEIDKNGIDDDKNGYIDDRYGWDFVNGVADPSPKFNPGFTEAGILHGTIIAGIAAGKGNNKEGIAGISWDARIMSLKALDDEGDGSTATVVRAIDYAVAKGAHIINLSFVGFAYSRPLRDAIQRANDAGAIVVAPAGNEQSDGSGMNLNVKPVYPACYHDDQNRPLVVGVAATDGVDQKASFSGYGDTCISLAAPGVSFFSTSVYAPQRSIDGSIFNSYYDGYWSGTSVAVPLVSGTLALIEAANPSLSAREVIDILVNSTDDINALNPEYENQLGQGRLNVFNAVALATAGTRAKEPLLAFAPNSGAAPIIRITDTTNKLMLEFYAYRIGFTSGVNLASGDVDGDGSEELITAPAGGMESEIKIFDQFGNFEGHFLAYPATYRGGVTIATADVNGDGRTEIITAPKTGMKSEIKIFTSSGKLLQSFLAYPESFRGGASIAIGDVMGDAAMEIVTGTGKGGVPQVKVFSWQGKKMADFIVGNSRDATGLNILLIDLDGSARRRQSEIIVTRQSGPALVSAYDFRGNLRSNWMAYDAKFRGNVKADATDLDSDGLQEILTAPSAGGGPHVRIFDRFGHLRSSFYAYTPAFSGGVNFAVLSIKR